MKKLIQLADEPSDIRTADRIKLLSHVGDQIPALTYLVSDTPHGRYFLQTTSMKIDLNISARNEFDPASMSGALKVLDGEAGYEKQAIWRTAEYYQAQLLAHEQQGELRSPTTRPSPGSLYYTADIATIDDFLGLSKDGWEIGKLAHQDVPIRLNDESLRHHILVGGTTGMGKTNTNAHIIQAAIAADFVPIIYDHNLDFIKIREPNPHYSPGIGIDAQIWSLGGSHSDAKPIYVPASELNPELLAATIFSQKGEEYQAMMFTNVLFAYITYRENQTWHWEEFEQWYCQFENPKQLDQKLPRELATDLRPETFKAIRRRVRSPSRIPNWIRTSALQRGYHTPQAPGIENFFDAVIPGSAHVIRLDGNRDNSSYALYLDYSQNRLAKQRRRGGPKMFNMVEEASTIFASGNQLLRDHATNSLAEHIRTGRRHGIGFCISTQSAGDVPPEIRLNLNSIIAFKHKNPSVLKEILPEQARDIFGLVNNLQRGEALIDLFNVRGLLHAKMFRSPFALYIPEEE
jgi:hypothetical protein